MKRIFNHLTNSRIRSQYSPGLSQLSGFCKNCRYLSIASWHRPEIPALTAQQLIRTQRPRPWINMQNIRLESTESKTVKLPDSERPEMDHGAYEMKDPESEDQVVNITVANKDGKAFKLRGKIGDNLLYLAKRFDVEMEGACEASLACTTCHVYVEGEHYDKLEAPSEKEEDLLDMAPFLKENSRLGCQIILNKHLEGLTVRLPAATKNFYVDGHKPSHH